MPTSCVWSSLGLLLLAIAGSPSRAQNTVSAKATVQVWTTRAIATVLRDVGGEFERATGYTLDVLTDLPDAFERKAEAGEPFDLIISGSGPVADWIRRGRLTAETQTVIAKSGIGVAIRAGAPKPDISSIEDFKRALLAAKSIAYLRVGSGLHVHPLLERLEIADAVKDRVTRPETDIVSELVAKGEIDLGIVVITQILTTPGVELVGPLPAELQSYVTFVGAVNPNAIEPAGARELLRFLRGPSAVRVIRAQGMELP
jgi:molybdate transport system substrate-binding protein